MQTRIGSLVEAVANVAAGYFIALVTQILVFPWFGLTVSLGGNLAISAIFTIVSLVRSYLLRRLFNWLHRPRPEPVSSVKRATTISAPDGFIRVQKVKR